MTRRAHCIPVGDLDVHAAQSICWCHPVEVEPGIWAHNAKDCREARERLTKAKSSDGWIVIAEFVESESEIILPEFDMQLALSTGIHLPKIKPTLLRWWCRIMHRSSHENYCNEVSKRFFRCRKCGVHYSKLTT